MEALVQALDAIVQEMPISQTIHDFKLNRLDLCKNTPVTNAVLLEYIRLLEKGASCAGWKPDTYPDHRASHSFRRANDRYQVTVYDKLYQITDQLLSTSWDNPFSLLRLEASLFSQGIDQQLQQFSLDKYRSWYLLMDALCCHGEEIMLRLFQRLVPDAPYYTLAKAKERILWDTDFSSSKKWKLICMKIYWLVLIRPIMPSFRHPRLLLSYTISKTTNRFIASHCIPVISFLYNKAMILYGKRSFNLYVSKMASQIPMK